MNINIAVSQNIKRIREERRLTLDGAAAATGVSRSMLAQIERGEANPSISVLWKIANGYKVSFTSLMEREREQASVIKAQGLEPIVEDGGKYINMPAFSFDEKKSFETYRIIIAPGGSLAAEAHLAGTEEYITVFAGEAEIEAAGERFTLKTGDSLRFMADVPHSYKNPGKSETQLSMLLYYNQS